ncbi:MAG: Ig-like domain-containing protein [Bacteroidales bacterium]|nr:Ig-like domain-containing protein [Bacteroidales bacterium]
MRRHLLRYSVCCVLLLCCRCAKIVTPTGGPRDTTPPAVTKETPANGSTNFNGNTIKISFNEYVVLDNPVENVLISPPPSTPPQFSISGKSVIIKFQNTTLLPNQTYNIGFASCIKDFTEGNAIPFYNYAFSTGDRVDSMMLSGKIIDALSTSPIKECYVFAYTEDVDSLPLTTKPQFISKSQADGSFEIKNIKPGAYKIFALTDDNNDLIFNLPTEKIAFGDHPFAAHPCPKDTANDTLSSPDTIQQNVPAENILLYLFSEKGKQLLDKSQNKAFGKYDFFYKENISDVHIRRIDTLPMPDHFQYVGHDTLTFFFKETLQDTLRLELRVNTSTCDTVELTPFKKKETRGKKEEANKGEKLSLNKTNAGELHSPLTLHFSYPIRPADSIPVQIVAHSKYSGNDTSTLFLSVPDTFVTSVSIPFHFEEKVPYTVILRDSSFLGYNGATHDSLKISFTAKSEKDYGALRISYQLPENEYNYIALLLNQAGDLIRKDIMSESAEILYSNLSSGSYKLKLIEDRNLNGEWDTGNYREKLQPEKVLIFNKPLNVRGYWELEEIFTWE